MKRCAEYEAMTEAWLDGELGGEGMDALRAHAAGCGACGASLKRAIQLKGDMRSLARCAEQIATVPIEHQRRLHHLSGWKIAAAILIAVTIAWAYRPVGRGDRPETERGPVVQAEKSCEVIQVADAGDIVLDHPSHEMAVQFESKRSDVKIVWLYSPIQEKASSPPTSAPRS
jgi:hypothetical protein